MARLWHSRLGRFHLDRRVRPVLGNHCLVGKPRRRRGSWVGILELHCAHLLHTRSGSCRSSDLRICLTFGDRCCPLLSAVHPSAADPARTEEGFRSRVAEDRSAEGVRDPGPIGRPGTARPMQASTGTASCLSITCGLDVAHADMQEAGRRPLQGGSCFSAFSFC
jgi:hypothetical protein